MGNKRDKPERVREHGTEEGGKENRLNGNKGDGGKRRRVIAAMNRGRAARVDENEELRDGGRTLKGKI